MATTTNLTTLVINQVDSEETYQAMSQQGKIESNQLYFVAGDSDTNVHGIYFGQVDSTSTSTVFTATIPGITEYYDGLAIMLKNGVVTSASGFTININGLGAKQAYSNMAAASAETTLFNINYTMLFIYDSTRVSGGGWILYRGYNSNDNTIGYQLRTNSSTMPASDKFYRYRVLFTSADGKKWVPSNTSTSTNATAARAVNQRPIDPFGEIVYYGTTTAIEANANVTAAQLWEQYAITLGYAFNRTGAALVLPYPSPIYIKCAPQADGSAIIDADNPYVFTLPNTEDGKIYIYFGRTYSATAVEMTMKHPVYYYKNGAIREWVNAEPIPAETDPIFSASAAAGITSTDITNWNSKTSNTGTITGVSVNGTSVATSGVANITSVPASILSGAIANGVTATTQSAGDNSTKVATTAYVETAIANMPEPMIFKGSLGTGGTITSLPTAAAANEGFTYKVITAGTYASQAAKIGDVFISNGSSWILIPSGDEPSGTVTSVTISATSPISIDSSAAITTSGSRTISHANSGVTAGTYRSVTVNATGHVTGGTNPTTLSGYGITDAKIASGTITLGSNTITPLTADSSLNAAKLTGTVPSSCYTDTKNTAGSTDTSSKIYLVGATSQAANPQTYSDNQVYATNGQLDSHKVRIAEAVTLEYNNTTKSLDFVFA